MRAVHGLDVWKIVQALVWAMLAVLLAWPLSGIVRASLLAHDHFGLGNFVEVFSQPRHLRAIGNTLLVGAGGMVGAMVLGVTLALLVVRVRLRGRAAIPTLAVLGLVSPPFIGAYAWIVMFGANGAVRRGLMDIGITLPPIYGAGGVMLVFSFKFFPNVFLIVSAALAQVNRSLEEAAEGLGMAPMRRFWRITLPMITPAMSAAALLAFVLSIADFGTPQLIGRGFEVLATQAFQLYAADLGENPGLASALSLVLVALSMGLVVAQRRLLRRDVFHGNALKPRPPARLAGWRRKGGRMQPGGLHFALRFFARMDSAAAADACQRCAAGDVPPQPLQPAAESPRRTGSAPASAGQPPSRGPSRSRTACLGRQS